MARQGLELLRGTLDMLILRTLEPGATHGYGIWRSIRERSDGALEVNDAALYQSLRRMEERGLIAAEWGVSENNRRARFYALTKSGRRRLAAEAAAWDAYAAAVVKVMRPAVEGA